VIRLNDPRNDTALMAETLGAPARFIRASLTYIKGREPGVTTVAGAHSPQLRSDP
jgi:hypothetical protein